MRRVNGWLAPVSRGVVLAVTLGVATAAGAGGSQDGRSSAAASLDLLDELFGEGQGLYETVCVSCHGTDGGESAGPALSGHPSMGARDYIVRRILRGNPARGMPAFAATFDDRRVAAVTTYIRNAWGNVYGAVLEADVKRVRMEAREQSAE